ncbi:quinone oxidoreductase family protein [Candidatus Viadribacter manganicus]|uniref:Quinone oxidoreductase n=1 Tax=Candidatus Viadribacter manganicus TaxID=1759059 RepID=A0A1B1AIA8_9PROT|nr:quinone oxidoreductase [Candidatus Viadribacter manganicus]ANP46297.1 quinone oxidoreductase [Candidatus Viadribacter manganicus]
MKAMRIESHGGPEVIALTEVETREPGPHQVRVRNHAIGVNFIDVYHRTGLYKNALPMGLGLEGAGIVEAVGADVTRFNADDRITYASGPIGAYAETHVVNETQAVKLPDAIAFDIAAASLLKGMTARFLLRKTFRVERGHDVVIHAAAGGVGQIAVQWAKHLGANVIAVVGSDEKAEIARKLGADHTIIPAREDIAKRVREITGAGAHVVYDSVGKDTFMASLDSLRPLGMLVSFGNASGPPPDINPLALAQRGSLFLTRPTMFNYVSTAETLDETAADLFAVLASGAVKVAAPARYALADAAKAHADLEGRRTTGSSVLVP